MTSIYRGTSDPRKKSDSSQTDILWQVGSDEPDGQSNLVASEVQIISQKLDSLQASIDSHPIKWTTDIRDLNELGLRMLQPISIVIEEYPTEDSVIARFPEVEAFGEASTEPQAILELKADIVRLYRDLSNTPLDELGPLPETWLHILKQIISEE